MENESVHRPCCVDVCLHSSVLRVVVFMHAFSLSLSLCVFMDEARAGLQPSLGWFRM